MNFTAILTYHAHVGTFRGGRGAWRVRVCIPAIYGPGIDVINYYPGNGQAPIKALRMEISRRLHPNTWVNPTKLLREYLAMRRLNAAIARASRCPQTFSTKELDHVA